MMLNTHIFLVDLMAYVDDMIIVKVEEGKNHHLQISSYSYPPEWCVYTLCVKSLMVRYNSSAELLMILINSAHMSQRGEICGKT